MTKLYSIVLWLKETLGANGWNFEGLSACWSIAWLSTTTNTSQYKELLSLFRIFYLSSASLQVFKQSQVFNINALDWEYKPVEPISVRTGFVLNQCASHRVYGWANQESMHSKSSLSHSLMNGGHSSKLFPTMWCQPVADSCVIQFSSGHLNSLFHKLAKFSFPCRWITYNNVSWVECVSWKHRLESLNRARVLEPWKHFDWF